jgi:hypothetical protein
MRTTQEVRSTRAACRYPSISVRIRVPGHRPVPPAPDPDVRPPSPCLRNYIFWRGEHNGLLGQRVRLGDGLTVFERRMLRRASRPARSSRFCTGQALSRRFAKCRRVYCTTNTDRSWRGDLKLRMRAPCWARSDANGTSVYLSFFWPAVTCRDVLLPLVSIRFKLFLEPRALRDETTIDPRLPQLPASSPPRRAVTYAVSHLSYLFLPFLTAGQNGYDFDRRLPDMSVGVRERRNHPRDRSGRRSK